jgi:hypothetical protein
MAYYIQPSRDDLLNLNNSQLNQYYHATEINLVFAVSYGQIELAEQLLESVIMARSIAMMRLGEDAGHRWWLDMLSGELRNLRTYRDKGGIYSGYCFAFHEKFALAIHRQVQKNMKQNNQWIQPYA